MASSADGTPDDLTNDRGGAETLAYGGSKAEARFGGAPANQKELTGVLGRYTILNRLGSGGMGSVYLAHDSQFDHKVALKVPHFTGTNDQTVIQRFHREARAAIKLRHSNLCPVYDVGEIEGHHYLAMAYIEGFPLTKLVDPRCPLPERQAARIVCKIAMALQEAHENGVVHRDLKPGNIMFDEKRKEPIVMDFGLAAQLGISSDARLTQAGMLVGSPAYMSPEQVSSKGDPLGPATDIYSLGVILYELLIGRAPFDGSTAEVLGMIALKAPDQPSRLRPGLDLRIEEICLKAMSKNIGDRFASMRDFAIALAAFANPSAAAGREANGSMTVTDLIYSADTQPESPLVDYASARSTVGDRPGDSGIGQVSPFPTGTRSRTVPVWAGGAVALASVAALLAVVFFRPGSTATQGTAPPAHGNGGAFDAGPRGGGPQRPLHPPAFGAEAFEDFDSFDRNRDGELSADEYPMHIILRADANRDRKLTRQEFDSAQQRSGSDLFGPPTAEEERELHRHGGPPGGGPGPPSGPGPPERHAPGA